MWKYLYLIMTLTTISSCSTAPDLSDVPTIEFLSFSKMDLNQGRSLSDSLYLSLKFSDGDGDIGSRNKINLVLTDIRTGNTYDQYRLPEIPQAGANNGITGTMRVKVYNTCCLQPDGEEVCEDVTVASNDLQFAIVLTDNAGNTSNKLITPIINLNCTK